MLAHESIVSWDDLIAHLEGLRSRRRIVFTNGCFDVLHPGHVDYLARARAYGDLLVVGVNDDDSVRSLGKGIGRPINKLRERMYVLAHLSCVDFVTWFSESTPYELIKRVRPDVLVKGGDWPVEKIVGRDIVEAVGGRVLSIPLLEGYSTTEMFVRVRELTREE